MLKLACSTSKPRTLTLVLGDKAADQHGGKKKTQRKQDSTPPVLTVWLGPPVMSWTPQEMAQETFMSKAYEVLKPILEIMERNIRWQSIKYADNFVWET